MNTVVHEPRGFYRRIDALCDALEDDEDAFLDNLIALMAALDAYKWDDKLPITPYSGGGNKHQCPIDAEFILVFGKRIERDRGGLPIRVHLDLLDIERLNPPGT
jgi:hypothetical protein